MSTERWRIEMLGGFRPTSGARTLTHFKSHKVASLLAYLAFFPTRRHTRDELLQLLWPDTDLDAARNNLRVALSLLRTQLAHDHGDSPPIIGADRSLVWIEPSLIVTDVAEFEANVAAALHSDSESERVRLLRSAVESYAGELLPGYHDDWILTERARLDETYLQTVRRLVRSLAASAEYEEALEFARRAAQFDPLREEAARDVMRLFLAVGQPSASLHCYRELERKLKEELNTRPATATRELAQRIVQASESGHLHGDPSTRQVGPQGGKSSSHKMASPRIGTHLTRFFGRDEDLARIRELALPIDDNPPARMITLTGPGGIGKTRLAMQAAERVKSKYSGRVWFVALADVTDQSQILDAIAEAMHVAPSDRSNVLHHIVSALQSEPTLLVLDNFEHLVEGGATIVRELLVLLPALTCIVTSRRILGISGEREYPVPPLKVPDTCAAPSAASHAVGPTAQVQRIAAYDGVRLFVDRAQAVEPHFVLSGNNAEDVATLCCRLEGIPLAIELAAARVRVLTPAQMLSYVGKRLDLLIDPHAEKDARHRSLRAALDWSYRLLPPDLRRLFARLSVFEGGWSLEAARTVCNEPEIIEGIEQLRTDSLIVSEVQDRSRRFRMLETIRTYAAEHLASVDRQTVQSAHAHYYLEIAEELDPLVKGREEARWMNLLQTEHDNMRAALTWYEADPDGGPNGLRLATALWRFWSGRGYLMEGRSRFASALAHPGAQHRDKIRSRGLLFAGDLATSQSDYAAAEKLYEESLAISREMDNHLGVAGTLGRLGIIKMRSGKFEESRALHDEAISLSEKCGDKEMIAGSYSYLGLLAVYQGDYVLARSCNERCLSIYAELGFRRNVAVTLGNLGLIADHLGEYDSARGLHEESLAIHRELGTRQGIAAGLSNLAVMLIRQGHVVEGKQRLLEGFALFNELGARHQLAIGMDALANIAIMAEDWQHAAWLFGAADSTREALGAALTPHDETQHVKNCELIRGSLGEEQYYVHYTRGRATSVDDVVKALLSEHAAVK